MRILSVNNNPKKSNFQARPFVIHSELGISEVSGEKLGEVFRDVDITNGISCPVVRVTDITNKILAAFYVDENSAAANLYQKLCVIVNFVKNTDGDRIRFTYFRKTPEWFEEKVSPAIDK